MKLYEVVTKDAEKTGNDPMKRIENVEFLV
jgi:hypothetical protein